MKINFILIFFQLLICYQSLAQENKNGEAERILYTYHNTGVNYPATTYNKKMNLTGEWAGSLLNVKGEISGSIYLTIHQYINLVVGQIDVSSKGGTIHRTISGYIDKNEVFIYNNYKQYNINNYIYAKLLLIGNSENFHVSLVHSNNNDFTVVKEINLIKNIYLDLLSEAVQNNNNNNNVEKHTIQTNSTPNVLVKAENLKQRNLRLLQLKYNEISEIVLPRNKWEKWSTRGAIERHQDSVFSRLTPCKCLDSMNDAISYSYYEGGGNEFNGQVIEHYYEKSATMQVKMYRNNTNHPIYLKCIAVYTWGSEINYYDMSTVIDPGERVTADHQPVRNFNSNRNLRHYHFEFRGAYCLKE